VTRNEGPSPHSAQLTEEQVYSVLRNVASVLSYIHSDLGLSHGDVYLHNVLRDGQFTARLSDWGASFVYNREDIELAGMFERIEVLAFGHLFQDLVEWHRVELTKEMKLFLDSMTQAEQVSRPNFREIMDKLGPHH
jgi:serine/threonine protein kinase